MRAAGMPPPLFYCLAVVSSLWGFSADDAREYSAALAVGDWRALRDLLRRNRAFVVRGGVGAQIRAGAFVEAGAGSRGSAPDVWMTDALQGQ